MLSLCHVFCAVADQAAAETALARLGLRESFRRDHPGQGTANVCACFENAYLELLWPTDWAALRSAAVAPTGLAERLAWRDTGASSVGIAIRSAAPLAVPCFGYRQDFWPPGFVLEIAAESRDPALPLIFRSPAEDRPDAWRDGRGDIRQDGATIDRLVLSRPAGGPTSPAIAALQSAGWLRLAAAGAAHLALAVGGRGWLSLPDLQWREEAG